MFVATVRGIAAALPTMRSPASDDEIAATDEEAEPITERVHQVSWSANLEQPRHAERKRVVADALTAVEHTAPGVHVNLVTHGDHGHPEGYLYDELDAAVGETVDYEFVERCGCGGYVTRVQVRG